MQAGVRQALFSGEALCLAVCVSRPFLREETGFLSHPTPRPPYLYTSSRAQIKSPSQPEGGPQTQAITPLPTLFLPHPSLSDPSPGVCLACCSSNDRHHAGVCPCPTFRSHLLLCDSSPSPWRRNQSPLANRRTYSNPPPVWGVSRSPHAPPSRSSLCFALTMDSQGSSPTCPL